MIRDYNMVNILMLSHLFFMIKSIQKAIENIKQKIRYEECHEDDNGVQLSLVIDRYRRHDHGGGENGDDWLEDHEISEDFNEGKKTHQRKLDHVNEILEEHGFKPNANFSLGEKGHFSIEIYFKK